MSTHAVGPSPVIVEATVEPGLSRWLWLVKWFLLIPHYVVLTLLWLVFVPLTGAALVWIVATGRYPRPLFAFNLGVLRWSWRVAYCSPGASRPASTAWCSASTGGSSASPPTPRS
jgi:hypothetical protein